MSVPAGVEVGPLAALESAHAALALADDVTEVKGIRDKAEALRSYAKTAGYGLEVQNRCAELKLRAERKAGELLAADPDIGPGKGSTLEPLGICKAQSSRWQKLAAVPAPYFDQHIVDTVGANRELTTAGALQMARIFNGGDPEQRPRLHVVEDGLPGLTTTFTTIVADPPWQYDNRGTRNAAAKHYPTMDIEELCDLPVAAHTNDSAHLYLWTTSPFLRQAFDVLDAWGFTYKTHLVWVKRQMGMGNYFRVSHEHVLFGIRGGLQTLRRDCLSWFEADRGRHSAKPLQFIDLVESSSPGPYLEMFARQRTMRNGEWTYWGNES